MLVRHEGCFLTTHYECFFLLTVDMSVNKHCLKFDGVSGNSLKLKDPHQLSWNVLTESFLKAASDAGKKHGISHVARLCYGRGPMLEVDFAGCKNVDAFLKSVVKRKFQTDLELLLRKQMRPETRSLSLAVNLFLAIPLEQDDARFTEVTSDNYKMCLETLKNGRKFDLRNITSDGEMVPSERGMLCVL